MISIKGQLKFQSDDGALIDVIINGIVNNFQFDASGNVQYTVKVDSLDYIIIKNKVNQDVNLTITTVENFTIFSGILPAYKYLVFTDSEWRIQNRNVAVVLGYAYVNVTDVVTTLANGVNDSGTPVEIPANATGASMFVEFTSTQTEFRYAVNGSVPNIASKRGIPVYEDNTEIEIGNICHNRGTNELTNFQAIMNTGKTCRLHVTYYYL